MREKTNQKNSKYGDFSYSVRTISLFILRRLEYDIPVYPNYTRPTDRGFQWDVVYSVKFGTFSGLRHVVTTPYQKLLIAMFNMFT